MGQADYYRHGDANCICDRCGFKFKHSQTRKEWTGLRVCYGGGTNDCWEARHPQDFVRARKDNMTIHDPRPEGTDVFATSFYRREDGTILHREEGFGIPLVRE